MKSGHIEVMKFFQLNTIIYLNCFEENLLWNDNNERKETQKKNYMKNHVDNMNFVRNMCMQCICYVRHFTINNNNIEKKSH